MPRSLVTLALLAPAAAAAHAGPYLHPHRIEPALLLALAMAIGVAAHLILRKRP